MKIEQKTALTIFGAEHLEDSRRRPFNVVAGGASRGGTSALGTVMRMLGLNMGENLHPCTHEDIEFADLINAGEGRRSVWLNLIHRRIGKYEGWSLKLPAVYRYLNIFEAALPNPLFIIVTRNAFSVAKTLVNRDEEYNSTLHDFMRGYSHAVEMYSACFAEIGAVRGCFAICEYERMITNPEIFVRDFADLCGIEVTSSRATEIAIAIGSSGYKTANPEITTRQ